MKLFIFDYVFKNYLCVWTNKAALFSWTIEEAPWKNGVYSYSVNERMNDPVFDDPEIGVDLQNAEELFLHPSSEDHNNVSK